MGPRLFKTAPSTMPLSSSILAVPSTPPQREGLDPQGSPARKYLLAIRGQSRSSGAESLITADPDRRTRSCVARMPKQTAPAKVEFFDDAGEIQIVPIDTVVDDGGFDLGADDSCRKRSQGSAATRGESRRYPWSRKGLRAR